MTRGYGDNYTPEYSSDEVSFVDHPMRVGSKVGRTIYVRTGKDKASDVLVGMVDTPELAAEIAKAVNRYYGHTDEREVG